MIKIRGLPYNVTEEALQEYFGEYKLKTENIIIEQQNGKRTGYGLIIFGSPEQAKQA